MFAKNFCKKITEDNKKKTTLDQALLPLRQHSKTDPSCFLNNTFFILLFITFRPNQVFYVTGNVTNYSVEYLVERFH